MAESPAHTFGQYLGNLLEKVFVPELDEFCAEYDLYLDKHGVRPARKGKKATWVDGYGNSHDLDFVIEKGGQPDAVGRPLAFIEAAWRRYTKHSRNKAQEIQGAVLPLAEKYGWDVPFKGAILAGCFTSGSLIQLKSLGFEIVYIEYDQLIADFETLGIDIRFDENTPTSWFSETLAEISAGGADLERDLVTRIRSSNADQFREFFEKLTRKLKRHVESLVIVPLFGDEFSFSKLSDALRFLLSYEASAGGGAFRTFQIIVRYSNGDRLEGAFKSPEEAKRFLEYASV